MHAPAGIFNPISIDLELAQEAQRQIAESLEIAVELQTGAVAVHPGRLDSIEDPLDEAWERTLEWITEMDELAFRLGLRDSSYCGRTSAVLVRSILLALAVKLYPRASNHSQATLFRLLRSHPSYLAEAR